METLINPVKGKMVYGIPEGMKVSIYISRVNGSRVLFKMVTPAEWEEEKKKKLAAGYTLMAENPKTQKEIEAHPVLVMLARRSRQLVDNAFQKGITFSAEVVAEAKKMLGDMAEMTDIAKFNSSLKDYFSLVPRTYKNFILETAANPGMIKDVISRELDMLNAYETNILTTAEDDDDIYFEDVTEEDAKVIKALAEKSDGRYTIQNMYRVGNRSQDERFSPEGKKTTLLFHGSRTENWYSIIKTGLKINPINAAITGKMYGYGIYFAPSMTKSAGYTSKVGSYWASGADSSGFIGIYEVVTGDPYETTGWEPGCSVLRKAPKGKDCLWAHGGNVLVNDEVIIYDDSKCRLKYLIQI